MKKILSVVTLLGTLAGAASALEYVLPTPPEGPGGGLTPYDWQPVFTIEPTYTLGAHNYDPDMWGVRTSLNLYSNGDNVIRHQFNLNAAIMGGEAKYTPFGSIDGVKMEGYMFPITLGYDLNVGITDNVFFYVGGKAGYAFCDFDVKYLGGKDSMSDGGFTYSVGCGLKVQCSDTIYVKAGYEYGRTYIEVTSGKHAIISGHTISLGVGWRF